jgi:WD repeat-containing protein 7
VVTFYATSLAQVVGSLFQAPSLSYLARHWFESSSQLRADSFFKNLVLNTIATDELRQAARILFDAGIARLSDGEAIILAEQWQHDRTNYSFLRPLYSY